MKLIFSAGSLYTLPAHTVFELACEAGFDGMEIIINHDFGGADNLAYQQSLQSIMPILSIPPPFFEARTRS